MMASSAQRSPTQRSSVLIVDDSPGVLMAMEKLLAPYMPVQVADGANTALEALSADTALVLTDVRMPGMDGLELARSLRASHPDLPVVFMTGIVEESLRNQAQELGVRDVLRKPLKPGVLIPALQAWLSDGLPNWDTVAEASPEAVNQERNSHGSSIAEGSGQEHFTSKQAAQVTAPTQGTAATQATVPMQATGPSAELPQIHLDLDPDQNAGSSHTAPLTQEAARIQTVRTQESVPLNHTLIQQYMDSLSFLPGVTTIAALDHQGKVIQSQPPIPEQIGAYMRFLTTSSSTLGQHLSIQSGVRAVQIEFAERTMVICPVPHGYLAVLVRDTHGASSVKAWIRTHLNPNQISHLN